MCYLTGYYLANYIPQIDNTEPVIIPRKKSK